jgi:hypothetical protein
MPKLVMPTKAGIWFVGSQDYRPPSGITDMKTAAGQ